MLNQEAFLEDGETTFVMVTEPDTDEWVKFEDDAITQQQCAIHDEEANKVPFLGDKEPLSSVAPEYQSGSPILLAEIKVLDVQYAAIR